MPEMPEITNVYPLPDDTSILLKPIIKIEFTGAGLIDPRSFSATTFALYGPGEVVYRSGPGTILNSGIIENPYTLIDDAVIRERIPGTFYLYSSGMERASGIDINLIGSSGTFVDNTWVAAEPIVYGEFVPTTPLQPYTQYNAVLVGQDGLLWTANEETFGGITTWTSDSVFSGISPSGSLVVTHSYQRVLPSPIWNADTGYNDTFWVEITSGTYVSEPQFIWYKSSSPGGPYVGVPSSGIQSLGDGLTFIFSGLFSSGQVFSLDTYIPQALTTSYSWTFTTIDISGSTPPVEPVEPPLVVDLTPDGGYTPITDAPTGLQLVATYPPHLAYGVRNDLPYILLEFNTALSGYVASGEIGINSTAMMGMPNVESTGWITPTSVEISGVFLKLWL